MKTTLLSGLLLCSVFFSAQAAEEPLPTLTVSQPQHGALFITPAPASGGKVAAGSPLTVIANPEPGYRLDSLYWAVPGRFGSEYHEFAWPVMNVTVNRDMTVGALFLPEGEFSAFATIPDVVYAQPGAKALKYDVFSPRGAAGLPLVVIIHGGGWTANTEDVMRGMGREIARSGRYVAVSIDYRWAGRGDGDVPGNDMADLIGDVFGALAHVREHARDYGGDPNNIAVTGDSAGAHLAAVAATMAGMIGEGGFGRQAGRFEFLPSYLPADMTPAQLRGELLASIKAAAPSYGVFSDVSEDGDPTLSHFSEDSSADARWAAAIAPIHHISAASERAVPHYLVRGTEDPLISDAMVRVYAEALEAKGQRVVYEQVPGASHAFFDWKPDQATRDTFARFGKPYIARMLAFFDTVFYPDR